MSALKTGAGRQLFRGVCPYNTHARTGVQWQAILAILLLTCLSCLAQPVPPLLSPNQLAAMRQRLGTNAPRTNQPHKVEFWFTKLDTNSIGYLQYATNADGPWTNLIETRIGTNGCITNRYLLGLNPGTNQFYRTRVSYLK